MKKIGFSLFIVLFFASCKKCYNCQNQCWRCTNYVGDTLCSTSYSSKLQFENILHDIQSTGSTCTKINSSKQKDICDESAEAILDENGFYCTTK